MMFRHGVTKVAGPALLIVVMACGTPPRASTPTTTAESVTSTTTAVPVTTTTTAPTSATITDELREARERWETADLSTYHYEFLDDCGECGESTTQQVAVWDDELFDPAGSSPSVEGAFSLIEQAVAEGRPVNVTFHPESGFPTEIWIDQPARARDGGTHWMFSNLADGLPGEPGSFEDHQAAQARWAAAGVSSYEYRLTVLCNCENDSTIWIRVEDGLVADWLVESEPVGETIVPPQTIDQLLEEVGELIEMTSPSVATTGSAIYEESLGFPVWVGLEIDIRDPSSEVAFLPPRLVLTVSEFTPVATDVNSELDQAKEAWAAAGIRDYSYLLTFHDIIEASFGDPLRVVVRDGAVIATTLEGEPTEIEGPDPSPVDAYFDLIESWIEDGSQVGVIYHTEFGHPTVVTAAHPDGSSTVFSISDLAPG